MTPQQMWNEYSRICAVDAPYDVWAFCGGGEAGDRLANLTLAGVKTATASAYIAYQTANEEIPAVGGHSVIRFDRGDAACIIRTRRLSLVPFDQVSERHAHLEGEGDRSLSYWRRVHREAFAPDYAAAGLPFDEKGLCVLEEFELVYPRR